MICGCLMDYTSESFSICQSLEKLKGDLKSKERTSPLAEIDARIVKCNSEISNLVSKLSRPNVGQALLTQVNARVEELSLELSQLNAEKKRLEDNEGLIAEKELQLDIIAKALSSLKTCFREMSISEKRTLIRLLIQRIEWDGQDLHVFIYGEQATVSGLPVLWNR